MKIISDGDRDTTCITTNATDTLSITFYGLNKVYRIAIYPTDLVIKYAVNCTGAFNRTIFYTEVLTHTWGPSFIHLDAYVYQIEITTNGMGLSLCEIEIYGSINAIAVNFKTEDYVLILPSPITETNLLYILLICILFTIIISKLEDLEKPEEDLTESETRNV
ncbi:uncharacterized protein LOC131939368 [Physella acuta]|uniref:uncharacterized protein LOC131939368 n=1 Tax=Physella acuta TaxID=109671 RepID=UPI0027DB9E59|nr:uncharacterized protein LOC131939368 [Physella acuta]